MYVIPAFKLADVDDSVIEKFRKLAAKKGCIDLELLNEPKEIWLPAGFLKTYSGADMSTYM